MLLSRHALGAIAAVSLIPLADADAQTTDPNWTGAYIGLQGGGTIDHSLVGTSGVLAINTNALFNAARPSGVVLNRDGAEGGGQIGYNFQRGRFVGGLEADISALDADASRTYQGVTPFGGVQDSSVSEKLDNLGTVASGSAISSLRASSCTEPAVSPMAT